IGRVGLVGEVDEVGVREAIHQPVVDGEPAHAGIEDADRHAPWLAAAARGVHARLADRVLNNEVDGGVRLNHMPASSHSGDRNRGTGCEGSSRPRPLRLFLDLPMTVPAPGIALEIDVETSLALGRATARAVCAISADAQKAMIAALEREAEAQRVQGGPVAEL